MTAAGLGLQYLFPLLDRRVTVNPDRLRYVDAPALAAALNAQGPVTNPGKLLNALQLVYTPDGVPLSSLLGVAHPSSGDVK